VGRFLALWLVAACGRFGLDTPTPPTVDANTSGVALLPCTPTRFASGVSSVTALAAAAQPDGYTLFTTDAAGNVRGWAYAFQNGSLAATAANVGLDTGATGALGAVSIGTSVVLSSETGMPTATGTTLYGLDGTTLVQQRSAGRAQQFAATRPLAASGVDGSLAFVTVDAVTAEVSARKITANGSDSSSPIAIVGAAAMASDVSIATAPGGYAVSYTTSATTPRQVELELLDTNLAVIAGPVAVDAASGDEFRSVVASSGGQLLVAWHAKKTTDEVWFALFGPSLVPISSATMLATSGSQTVAAGDAAGFTLAWLVYNPTPNHLDGAHVAPDGTVAPRTIATSGGTPSAWALLSRAGQAALAWIESSGNGPDLYFDAMCGP
jgi:hypothetical protein